MKKLLTIFIISFLASCVSYKQEVLNLNLSPSQKHSDFNGSKSVKLVVVDKRSNKNLLGQKRIGEDVISITPSKDLVNIVKEKLEQDLNQAGFLVVDGGLIDKVLEVRISDFNYQAYREFFIGNSKIRALLNVSAKDNVSGKTYTTKQSLSLDKSHFIMPLLSTDEKTINFALQETMDSVFEDQKLLDFLKN